VPVPECVDCLLAVKPASAGRHPRERPAERRPQTENKLDVLSDYFGAWPNTILSGLRKFPPKAPVHLWIVDLFAGRGWHGSATRPEARRPGTAAAAGFRLWQAVTRTDWPFEVHGHVVAVDADEDFESDLHGALDRFAHPRLDVRIILKNCAEVIPDLRRESLGGYTLWLFDPYGLKSIPFCLFDPLFGDKKTELLINFDAGDAQRVLDAAVKKAGSHDLSKVASRTLDCLFGGDAWREIPSELTTTARREAWLANHYAGLFPAPLVGQALPMTSTSGFTRFFVQAAAHPTARERFKKSYDNVQKLWKKPREKLDDLARMLARELAGQEATPELIQALGIFPGDSLERIRGACHQTLHLGLAASCDPDGRVVLLPLDRQRGAPRSLIE
jgi:three-Cys-motif partner protein